MAKDIAERDADFPSTKRGRQSHQKLKPFLVLQYLLKHSDEDHVVSTYDIIDYLEECGITSDRRSIYRDIDEINIVLWMLENGTNITVAEEVIVGDTDNEERIIVYDTKRRGFYVRRRQYELNEIRLLAECVYSARFINEARAKRLVKVVCDLVSEEQAKAIEHDVLLTDRRKTANTAVYNNVNTINEAMRKGTHKPEKITFKYQRYTIADVRHTVDRRNGKLYKVSPFRLLMNDGYYYLLAFDDRSQEMRTYRVDRMKQVTRTGEARDGEHAFSALDLQNYTQRVFGMMGGQRVRLTLRFANPLLDTVIDRFGTEGISYAKAGEDHFTVIPEVEISDQFLLGSAASATV